VTLQYSQHWWVLPLVAVATTVISLALIPLARKMALMDHPGERKVHQTVTPLTGGLAIFIVLLAAVVWVIPSDSFLQGLGLGCLAMVITGIADDQRHLSPVTRFLAQIGACLIVVLGANVYLQDFGHLMWDGVFSLGWFAVPITLFAAIGVINAYNMIDGMDGLAGGIFLVSSAGLCLFAILSGQGALAWFLLFAMASVIGFLAINGRLPWNGKARVFLGNAGSLLLGFVLAWLSIVLGSGDQRAFAPMTAVWLFAVPLLDTTTLIWWRWRSGKSVFNADQHHIHHAFLRAGFSVSTTWWLIVLLASFFAGVGIAFELYNVPEFVGFYCFIGLAFCYYFYMKRSWRLQKFLGRDFVYGEFDVEAGLT
jgi:UDP-GlcNAc:undecaprenyl-phosphate GlcNAc-1-phosphate transferase